ncbi:MAG: tRNA uridine-5-carboxymethylaminomethyl(34) synthesis GTPase MnmE [Rhodoblastus sp.]
MADSDTIFALATPPGRSALAVIRISGSKAGTIVESLTKRACAPARVVSLRFLFDPLSSQKLDQALVTFFKGPASFTGENLAELYLHGGRGVIAAVCAALSGMEGVRGAEPGEFTRRAFRAGKFDLTQAEAIADLIDSETEFQRRQALRLIEGGLGQLAAHWQSILISIVAELESALDFSDEGDVGVTDVAGAIDMARNLIEEVTREIAAGARSSALRDGFTIVISGPPNAGKSTLFNKLAGSDIAIVSEFAGTTRDLLRVHLDLQGVPVTMVDSAGIREAENAVERIGIERALSAVSSADLVVRLRSGDTLDARDALDERAADFGGAVLDVWSKADIFPPPPGMLAISSNDSDSISSLACAVRERAIVAVGDGSEGVVVRERHRRALRELILSMDRFITLCHENRLELAVEDCRAGNLHLQAISGGFGVEDVLDEIFQRFCIGK